MKIDTSKLNLKKTKWTIGESAAYGFKEGMEFAKRQHNNGWIHVSERLPKKSDATKAGWVMRPCDSEGHPMASMWQDVKEGFWQSFQNNPKNTIGKKGRR